MPQQFQDTAFDGLAQHVRPAAGFGGDVLPLQPDHVDQQALREAVLAQHTRGDPSPRLRQLQVPVAGETHQTVAPRAGDGLADGGAALVQALGDAGTQGDHVLVLVLDLEDGA
jgi:hypothetical protein